MAQTFTCCKTRPFPAYYICKICFGIFHKGCILKSKKDYKLISGNLVICCVDPSSPLDDSPSVEDQRSIFEQTIEELVVDGGAKDKYISKLKEENMTVMDEATKMEEELNEMLKNRNRVIENLNVKIERLQKLIDALQTKNICTRETQTDNAVKVHVEVQTEKSAHSERTYVEPNKRVGSECTVDVPHCGDRSRQPDKVHDSSKSDKDLRTTKTKLLVYGDREASGISGSLRDYIRGNVLTEGTVRPGADLAALADNVFEVTKDCGQTDYAILMFSLGGKAFDHKSLIKILALSKITNVLICCRFRAMLDVQGINIHDRFNNVINSYIANNRNSSIKVICSSAKKLTRNSLCKRISNYVNDDSLVSPIVLTRIPLREISLTSTALSGRASVSYGVSSAGLDAGLNVIVDTDHSSDELLTSDFL